MRQQPPVDECVATKLIESFAINAVAVNGSISGMVCRRLASFDWLDILLIFFS